MKDWHVKTDPKLTEQGLEGALNDLDSQDHTIEDIIPHQAKRLDGPGREVGVDIVSTTSESLTPRYHWEVHQAQGYGYALQDLLSAMEHDGWEIFQIIPHRIGTENFPEVVVRKPREDQ